jgi:hypothetical protein
MNYIKHLAGFFDRVSIDERLNPTHVSMYVSLFQFWNANRFQNPISISRNELMKVSKISAKATYHKCMKELNEWQYLKYKPSYNPFKGSLVYLFNFQTGEIEKNEPPNLFSNGTGNEQAVVANHTKIETSVEQAQEPYINISKRNKQNRINLGKQAKKLAVQNLNGLEEKEKLRQKKKNVTANDVIARHEAICTITEVQEYFKTQSYPPIEAQKFYNYFQSNGWKIGGKAPMKDWQAAAQNWILNIPTFSPQHRKTTSKQPIPGNLNTATTKNYSEPL